MATYEKCGHEVPSELYEAEVKCPVCRKPVSYIRNATDQPEPVVVPGKKYRHIERRSI